jgi:hypothetical protein
MKPIRILLADDHAMLRRGLRLAKGYLLKDSGGLEECHS